MYLKGRAVLRHSGWWYMPVIQHLGSEDKENHVFKVTLNYTKREADLGY